MISLSQTAAQLLFWSAATVAIIAQAMVLRAAFAGRTPAANSTAGARARDILWTVLPALTLVVLLWFTWRALPGTAEVELTPTSVRSVDDGDLDRVRVS